MCTYYFIHFHQVEQCRMPGLAVYLTLDVGKAGSGMSGNGSHSEGGDVVSYVTGLLLSHNHQQRTWFAQFVKSSQRVSGLSSLGTSHNDTLYNEEHP